MTNYHLGRRINSISRVTRGTVPSFGETRIELHFLRTFRYVNAVAPDTLKEEWNRGLWDSYVELQRYGVLVCDR